VLVVVRAEFDFTDNDGGATSPPRRVTRAGRARDARRTDRAHAGGEKRLAEAARLPGAGSAG